MALTREKIRDGVINALIRIQKDNDADIPEITDDTCPMDDLPGFDSTLIFEIIFHLEDEFGFELSDKIFQRKEDKELSVSKMVDAVCREKRL